MHYSTFYLQCLQKLPLQKKIMKMDLILAFKIYLILAPHSINFV